MQRGTLPPVIFLHLGARGHRCGGGAVIVSVLGVTLPYCGDGEGPPPLRPVGGLPWLGYCPSAGAAAPVSEERTAPAGGPGRHTRFEFGAIRRCDFGESRCN